MFRFSNLVFKGLSTFVQNEISFSLYFFFPGEAEYQSVLSGDNSVSTVSPWGHTISIDTVPYPILADIDPVLAESYPVPAKQKTDIGGDLANRFEWKYFVRHANNNPKSKGTSKKSIFINFSKASPFICLTLSKMISERIKILTTKTLVVNRLCTNH